MLSRQVTLIVNVVPPGDVDCGAGMYHCPTSFCIPYRKICDGVRDCPMGEDEQDCGNYTCSGRTFVIGSVLS